MSTTKTAQRKVTEIFPTGNWEFRLQEDHIEILHNDEQVEYAYGTLFHSTTALIEAIKQKNRFIAQLEQENKDLKTDLESYRNDAY